MPKHSRVVQHLLYASSDLCRSLRLGHPQRFQHRQHVLGVDLSHRDAAERGVRMIPQGGNPVLACTFAPPASFVACDVGGSAFAKCRRLLGALRQQRGSLVAFVLEWVKSPHKAADGTPAPSGGLAAG